MILESFTHRWILDTRYSMTIWCCRIYSVCNVVTRPFQELQLSPTEYAILSLSIFCCLLFEGPVRGCLAVLGHSSVALECLLYLIALVDRWCFICVTGPLLQSIANAFEETQVIFAKKFRSCRDCENWSYGYCILTRDSNKYHSKFIPILFSDDTERILIL
jgi:hypothetical protein